MESFLKLLIHTDEKCSYKRRSISFSHIVVFIGTWISRQLCSIRQWWQIYGGEWVSGHLACHLITAIQKMLGRVHMFCSPSCGHFASMIGNTTTTWWCYMLYLLHCGNTEAKNGSEAKCFCRLRRAGAHHGTTTTCSPVYMCELAVSLDFDLAWLCLLQTTASSSSFILLLLLRFLLFTRREFPFPRREFAADGNLLVASKWLLPDCFDAAVRSSVSGSCFLQLMESEWSVGSAPAANTASHPYLILKLCSITDPYLALGYLTN